MPYTIVFYCGICDMPFPHTVCHLLLNWSSGGHPAVEMADRSPDSPHSSPWGSSSAEKPSKAWQALCVSYLCLPFPSLHFAQPQKPLPSLVSCPLYSLFGSEKGPYIFLDLLPWHQRAWESSPRSRTGQHLPRCTTGGSTFRPLLHLSAHA